MLEHGDDSKGTKSHYNLPRTTSAKLLSKNCAAIKTQSGSLSRTNRMETIDLCTTMHIGLLVRTRTQTAAQTKRKFSSSSPKRISSLSGKTLKWGWVGVGGLTWSSHDLQHSYHMICVADNQFAPDRQGHCARHPPPQQSREMN